MHDLNDFTETIMLVNGNEVAIFSPTAIRVTIGVPWENFHMPTQEERNFVALKNVGVLKYLHSEGYINLNGVVNVMVLTRPNQR